MCDAAVVPAARHALSRCVVAGAGVPPLVAARITRVRIWRRRAHAVAARGRSPRHFPHRRHATPAPAGTRRSDSACSQSRGVAESGSDRQLQAAEVRHISSAAQKTPATQTASAGASAVAGAPTSGCRQRRRCDSGPVRPRLSGPRTSRRVGRKAPARGAGTNTMRHAPLNGRVAAALRTQAIVRIVCT